MVLHFDFVRIIGHEFQTCPLGIENLTAARHKPRPVGFRWADGAAITMRNERGEMRCRAHVTAKIPPGTVWMRDGWADLNTLTSGDAILPDAAVDALGFSAGQAAFDAQLEVAPLG